MKKLIEEKNSILDDFDALLYYDRDKMFLNACYDKGYSKGKNEGKTEGYNNAQTSIAKEMLIDGVPLDKIVQFSKLSLEEVMALQNE